MDEHIPVVPEPEIRFHFPEIGGHCYLSRLCTCWYSYLNFRIGYGYQFTGSATLEFYSKRLVKEIAADNSYIIFFHIFHRHTIDARFTDLHFKIVEQLETAGKQQFYFVVYFKRNF